MSACEPATDGLTGGSGHQSKPTDKVLPGPAASAYFPGSVWTVPTAPLSVPEHLGVDHFAAFPPEWPKRIIQGWSPSGVCTACGEGRRPVGLTELDDTRPPARQNTHLPNVTKSGNGSNAQGSPLWGQWTRRVITGYACACPDTSAPTRPAVVLDPFGGTGTTAMVATALGRTGISVDLSMDYARLAKWRTTDRAQIAKVRGEDFRKEEPQHPGQESLFGNLAL